MKTRTLILVAFMGIINSLSSQSYVNFPTDSTIWNYLYLDPGGIFITYQEIIGDTTLLGVEYIIIETCCHHGKKVYVREENRRIYNQHGDIIFDFNLDSADYVQTIYSYDSLFVVKTDSITFENNEKRRAIYLSLGPQDDYRDIWVEGIGSMSYPLDYQFGWESGGRLDCFIYKGEYFINNNCFYTDINKNEANESIKIYPNPASTFVIVDIQVDEKYIISIQNIYGQQVYSKICDNDKTNIDLSSFPVGIYVVTIQYNNSIINKKIIKAHNNK